MTDTTGNGKTILVIEDDKGIRSLCEEILKMGGHKVASAAENNPDTIQKALAELGAAPDLIITDFNLGTVMTGGQWLENMRAGNVEGITSETPAMIMSGGVDIPTAQQMATDLKVTFLQKPFGGVTQLLTAVERALEGPGSITVDGTAQGPHNKTPPPRQKP